MNPKVKATALMGLVFVAGGVCGIAGAHLLHRHLLHRAVNDPEFVVRTLCGRMESQVGLTKEQRATCDVELRAARQQFLALHEQVRPHAQEILSVTRDHLCAMLTPQQKPKFSVLLHRWQSAHDAIAPPFLSEAAPGSGPVTAGSPAGDGCVP